MTIRTFQKTAGIEIKKKIYQTPTGKIIKEEWDKCFNNGYLSCLSQCYRIKHGLDWCTMDSLRSYRKDIDELGTKLCTTKTGKIVATRVTRFKNNLSNYRSCIGYIYSSFPDRREIAEFLLRIGWRKFMLCFDYSQKGVEQYHMATWVNNHKYLLN